jgi:putative methionine-R-sulfoxide reductase with GAF domain
VTTSEVIKKFPGLKRELLYFWEDRKKWIQSDRVKRGKMQGRDYNKEQVRRIKVMWKAYKEGYTPEEAHNRASLDDASRNPHITALFTASGELMKTAFHDNPHDALQRLAETVHRHLSAEAFSIFLVREDSPDMLSLEAHCGGTPNYSKAAGIKIQSVPKGGLTGHIAKQGKIFLLHGKELREHRYATGRRPEHLASGKCFSLLAVPIVDRKGALMGLLKAENRRNADGLQGDEVFFDEVDSYVAQVLVNEIVFALESIQTIQASRDLIAKMREIAKTKEATSLQQFLDEVLNKVKLLLRADRGEVTWWEEARQVFTVKAFFGEGDIRVGETIPHRSITRRACESGLFQLIPNVAKDRDYHCCNKLTRSELVFPIKWGNSFVGSLNVESFRLKGFDKQDAETLRHLADFVAFGVHMIESNDREQAEAFREVRAILNEMQTQTSPAEVLRTILKRLAASDFDRTRIFEYDESKEMFLCLDSCGAPKDGHYKGFKISAKVSRYARHTIEFWKNSPLATVRDPLKMYGPDPSAKGLNKPDDLEWSVAPLVIMGRLYGYIAGDNAESRRKITAKNLNRMDLYSALAAQGVANTIKKKGERR